MYIFIMSTKAPHAYFHNVHKIHALFKKRSIINSGRSDFTNCLPHNVKAAKISKFEEKNVILSKSILSPSKTPHTHLHYNHTMYARSEKIHWKLWKNSTPYNVKSCTKWLSLKGRISALKTVGRVDCTNSIPLSVTNGRTDRRTDRSKS